MLLILQQEFRFATKSVKTAKSVKTTVLIDNVTCIYHYMTFLQVKQDSGAVLHPDTGFVCQEWADVVSVSLETVIVQDRCPCSVKVPWWKGGGGGDDSGGKGVWVGRALYRYVKKKIQPCML